jgi:hypothetical protein
LDIYHGDTGKVLYGAPTEEYEQWREATTMELLESGFEEIEKRLDEKMADRRRQFAADASGVFSFSLLPSAICHLSSEGRAIGRPSGQKRSGQVEGACKNSIGKRLKQTWAEWKEERANKIAIICAALYSNQWKYSWKIPTNFRHSHIVHFASIPSCFLPPVC